MTKSIMVGNFGGKKLHLFIILWGVRGNQRDPKAIPKWPHNITEMMPKVTPPKMTAM